MISDLMKAVEAAVLDDRPIPEILREYEVKRGFQLLATRNGFWLPDTAWHEDTVGSLVRLNGLRALRLVLAVARQPRSGAFTELQRRTMRHGWALIVVDPTDDFAAALKRRGFTEFVVGDTFENRETWLLPAHDERQASLLAGAFGLPIIRLEPAP